MMPTKCSATMSSVVVEDDNDDDKESSSNDDEQLSATSSLLLFLKALEAIQNPEIDLGEKHDAMDGISSHLNMVMADAYAASAKANKRDKDTDFLVHINSRLRRCRHERVKSYIEQHGLVRVLVEVAGKYLGDKLTSNTTTTSNSTTTERNNGEEEEEDVLHFYNQILMVLCRLPGDPSDSDKVMEENDSTNNALSDEIAAAVVHDGGLGIVFDFLNVSNSHPWGGDENGGGGGEDTTTTTYCVTSCYFAFMVLLNPSGNSITSKSKAKPVHHDNEDDNRSLVESGRALELVRKFLPVLADNFKHHALSNCEDSLNNFCVGCDVLRMCFDILLGGGGEGEGGRGGNNSNGFTQQYRQPVVQAIWKGLVAYSGDQGAQHAGESAIRVIVGDKPYTQTVIALANCLTWPKGDHYSIMIIRDAFLENFSVTDLLHDFDDGDNDFQVTGRKILRRLVCDEVYIQLIDHAEMHQNEECNCAGCA